jgi:hypothetical protein
MSSVRIQLSRDSLAGLLLGIPVALPSGPLYWFAFLSIVILVRPRAKKIPIEVILILLIVMCLGIASSLFAPRPELIVLSRAILSVASLGLFVYGFFVEDFKKFLNGFLLPTNILALAVPVMFLVSGIFLKGSNVFVVPNFRLWGASYFPDWPNFIALVFCLGFMLQLVLIKRPTWALINLLAAVLTTSRIVFLAIFLLLIVWTFRSSVRLVYVAGLVLAIGASSGLYSVVDTLSVNLAERLTRTADREAIYNVATALAESEPILGFGSVLFDKSLAAIRHDSFHSFYLDLLIRFGAPVLILFTILLLGFDWRVAWRSRIFLPVALLILLGSFLQNYLRHPHFFLFYSAWILNLHKIVRLETADEESKVLVSAVRE